MAEMPIGVGRDGELDARRRRRLRRLRPCRPQAARQWCGQRRCADAKNFTSRSHSRRSPRPPPAAGGGVHLAWCRGACILPDLGGAPYVTFPRTGTAGLAAVHASPWWRTLVHDEFAKPPAHHSMPRTAPGDRRGSPFSAPVHGAAPGRGGVEERGAGRGAGTSGAAEDCCDRCGSVRLIRVKACWRCEACGYKSDCNGW